MSDPRSRIPSVDSLLASADFEPLIERYPRARVVGATRAVVEDVRAALERGYDCDEVEAPRRYARAVAALLGAADVPSLRRVINATGVVLHTNLGRAPLADAAVEAMRAAAAGYTNLEYDLDAGVRGSRYGHCVGLLTELTGADDALVVNNAAGALLLAVGTLAPGRGVAVSRGELVEIGGGFRIPEVLERAGARLVEVGSTNRTRIGDYRKALARTDVATILKVHRSNFRISGFTEEASLAELAALSSERGIPLVHDLGSGLLIDPAELGLPDEPRPVHSLEAGADVVAFSGDKLLGGPQAGIVVGRAEVVARLRESPLCRALRVDKVGLAGLEATLRLYSDPARARAEIPTLSMLTTPLAELERRARALSERLGSSAVACSVRPCRGAVGGGTFPGTELESWAVVLDPAERADALASALRQGDPPVVGRIVDDEVLLDVRTLLPGEEDVLLRRVVEALRSRGGAA